MKLRNKKTGEIAYIEIEFPIVKDNEVIGAYLVGNLKELNEKWEDYEPKEPLIKAEKIRKIIREWAELNAISEIIYSERKDGSLCVFTDYGIDDTSIEFVGWIPTLKDGKEYTIAELCGEEEE